MADYKELLRRAVQALPENNGQARRAVYEKARAALVGQLRAITPPLAARDITTHRLQLEDCIRQVEQEASEAVIAGMQEPPPPPAKVQTTQPPKLETRAPGRPEPAPAEPPPESIEDIIAASEIIAPEPAPEPPRAQQTPSVRPSARAEPKADPKPAERPVAAAAPQRPAPARPALEEVDEEPIEAEEPVRAAKPNGRGGRQLPSIVARAEARNKPPAGATVFGIPPDKPYDGGRRGPSIEPRRDTGPRLEPAVRGNHLAAARVQAALAPEPLVSAAMSSVREVELEEPAVAVDPQSAIDRAIATLDREARGENAPAANGVVAAVPDLEIPHEVQPEAKPRAKTAPGKRGIVGGMFRDREDRPEKPAKERPGRKDRRPPGRRDARPRRDSAGTPESVFQRPQAEPERSGAGALTIFLSVFAVLLLAAGGGGLWAWQEGYLNLDTMFARSAPVQSAAVPGTLSPAAQPAAGGDSATGPGNTAAAEPNLPTAEPKAQPKAEERLPAAEPPAAVVPPPVETATVEPLALAATPGEDIKTEERLPGASEPTPAQTAQAAAAAVDPANAAGSQSLLLEASDSGTTGAVPYSGTVEWSTGKDETGLSTLIAKANIPARNLSVDVLIRKNSDPSLPASHLMEINFTVAESFIGGSVAGLPGVLLKNEELVQGAPLVGASARVVGNQFLFALSSSAADSAANVALLTSRKWIDLAVIYATGKRAIITLEKDAAAEALFTDVFAEWSNTASAQ